MTNNILKTVIIFLFCTLLSACSFNGNRTISSSPVAISEQPVVCKISKPLETPGHFTNLSIAIPNEYRLDNKTWRIIRQDGAEVKIKAKLTTTDGQVHEFKKVAFGFAEGKQYLHLFSDLKYDPKIKYVQISIISSDPITTDEIKYYSDDK